ncbi:MULTISPECIES: ABC transporter substrate-binding protein [unclassified Mesorhizobium]|uniref:ABC transporter substrate-binding protein n=1 Tax=unclassified Mesorhizobium TaxID=325217 RepID=UPI0003CEC1B1|nr:MULTISPECIES: ABC transporter substrate-binding protein [unclassified Mesorhizobium]ESX27423.1 nickel ABC transporter substrate-binding protein [Mesorhizobium sp. LSHC440B00]ESX35915.1 nickel ABC transporter substrate-binding protein [Mesorhizobium sp. LSHC432A00]ESX41322.1 nickel ABC transporter substrate-binding protein [Mesorhizobium sp. LSHC440A00]WJI55554.1 ABC transporter substrate-binding protein [Mesorhizobium sp. C432A]
MITLDRRNFLVSTAGLAFAAALPRSAFSETNDTLKIAIAAETGDLDLLQNVSTLSTYTIVFDALIHYGQNGALEPGLATKWTVADDQLSIAFDLREGVTFSDGTPFDSAAAEWNLKRWLGVSDFSWIGISDAFDSIVTDGPNKLTVKLKRPVPAALLELTIVRPVRFLSPKAVDKDGKQTAPIGTGPWIVEKYDSSGTTLIRNDKYWGEKPLFSRMELKVVPDELARANGLRSGDLDVIGGDWVATLSPRRARALESDGMKVVAEPGTATMLLGYSPKSKIIADKAVRDAVYASVDRAAIAKVLFEGFADPAADLFPANVPSSGKRHDVPVRDVAAAKKILADGGWVDSGGAWTKAGSPLTIDFLVSEESLPGSRRIAEMIQGQLSEVGFQVQVSSVDNATMHERRPAFNYDLALFTTYGAPYDPHGTLGNAFVSTADSGPDGKIYVSDALDGVVKAALEASGAERDLKMQALYDWLHDNTAICPLVVSQRLWAHNPRAENFSLPATDYDLPFKAITLKA